MIQADSSVVYVHSDHLSTPRLATNTDGVIVWRWVSEAFGEGLPNEDVDGDGELVTINHRFPGQYFDRESELSYNYFRDYDAGLGRYVQSDPIGLAGGVNTYAYVGGNSLKYSDPFGLNWVLGGAGAALTICSKSQGCKKVVKQCIDNISESSRAARRKAMRDRNSPTSRPTQSQQQNRDGTRQDTTEGSDGRDSVQTQHSKDNEHPNDHWHSATP